MRLLTTAVLVLMLCCSARSATISVPDDYALIQTAIDSSSNGDTVLVSPGNYYENIVFNGHSIVLASHFLTTGDTSYIRSTIIDADQDGKAIVIANGEDSTTAVVGFTIRRGFAFFGYGGGIFIENASPTISHNLITANTAYYKGGGIFVGAMSARIEENTIDKNVAFREGGGIYCDIGSTPQLTNNTISRNLTYRIGGGVYLDHSDAVLLNNTIANNVTDSVGGGIHIVFGEPVIRNCIIWGNEAFENSDVWVESVIEPSITYCDVAGGWPGEGNIDVDPGYYDPFTANFNTCSQSLCIDAGDPSLTDPDITRSDIGRYFPDHPDCVTGKRIYVATDGDDYTGDGTETSPFETIQRSVDFSLDGDTVVVKEGTYFENISFEERPVVLGSLYLLDGDTSHISATVIDGDSAGPVLTIELGEDSTTFVTGLTIRNGLIRFPDYGGGIRCYHSSPVITDNIITGNHGTGIALLGGLTIRPKPVVERNRIIGNTGDYLGAGVFIKSASPKVYGNTITGNETPQDGGGIYCAGSSHAVIRDNVIVDNVARASGGGVQLVGDDATLSGNLIINNRADSSGGGIQCAFSSATIYDCTIAGNRAPEDGGLASVTNAAPVVYNTIIWDNVEGGGAGIGVSEASTIDMTYSVVEGGWEGEGNIDSDPMFCDPPNLSFEITEDSPCVGAGIAGDTVGALGVGCVVTRVEEDSGGQVLPGSVQLQQNYPNPFNPTTTIEYSLPSATNVRIEIFNVLGRRIATLVDQRRPAGQYRAIWNSADHTGNPVSSGVYFYRMETEGFVFVRKMLLLR